MSGKQLQLTDAGLPNTCSNCGELQHVAWYAEHDDQARSGGGLCAECAGVKPKPKRKRTRRKPATKKPAVSKPATE